jgi:hypothetical protein
MSSFWTSVILLVIVFVLTYDPKSRTLERFVNAPSAPAGPREDASRDPQCKHSHLQAVQFGQDYQCAKNPRANMGAMFA